MFSVKIHPLIQSRIFSKDLPCMKHDCILQVRGGKEGVHEMKREWGRNIVYLMLYLHNTKEFLYFWTVIYSGKNYSENKIEINAS